MRSRVCKSDSRFEAGAFRLIVGLALFAPPAAGGAIQETAPSERVLSLSDLEQMALETNPTLAQARALILTAEGRKLQAGLYPNPIMGYLGEELGFRSLENTSEHLFFLEQSIVTAGKLRKSRDIFAREQTQAELEAEAQRLRVLNSVRLMYYETLGAQRLVDLRRELAAIAREAVTISEQLFNVGQADRPDVLEANIESQQAQIELTQAENQLRESLSLLAVMIGDPALEPMRLVDEMSEEIPRLDREELIAGLLRESPEIGRAQAGIEKAEAALERAKAEPIPNVVLRGGFGWNLERLDVLDQRVGPEAFIEIGIEVPLFDRNQGNIAAARAQVDRSQEETRRLELALRSQLATVFAGYTNALETVERYRDPILSEAEQAYRMYLEKFQQMGAAYPQVIIAQRTLFQVRARYTEALVDAWQHVVQLRGLLLAGGLTPPEEIGDELVTTVDIDER